MTRSLGVFIHISIDGCYCDASGAHDGSLEAAMTASLVGGPAGAVGGFLIGVIVRR